MLDDNLEINIWSQNCCTADCRLTTADLILERMPACSCLARLKLSYVKWGMTSLAKRSKFSFGMGSGNSKKK